MRFPMAAALAAIALAAATPARASNATAATRVVPSATDTTASAPSAAKIAPSAPSAAETTATVPELAAFHEVIYPMWHTAWPARDTTLLRELWPGIQAHVAALKKAELPGILRDRQDAWQEALERLATAEEIYGAGLEWGSIEDKLAAAEALHSAYEGLVWAIRPALPELARFHAVLYPIYHYYLPQKDRKAVVAALPALTACMDTLGRVALPARIAKAQPEFDRARRELAASVTEVARVAPQADWAKTEKAIETMHSCYQAVERVFE